MTSKGHPIQETNTATRGARWITIAQMFIGLSNYAYALMLTHLLDVAQYSAFAAGQSLILWATSIATVSVPWVLAQALVRARSLAERNAAVRFAKLISAGSGIVGALIVGVIAARLGGLTLSLAVALSTFVIFLGTTTTGWLQGEERMRSLSLLYVAENVVKNVAGIFLVVVVGFKGAGALAAFGLGGLAMLVRRPHAGDTGKRSWRELVRKDLWQQAIATAGAQGMVSLFIAVDVVLVALLPGSRNLAASYQASATLTRIPLYLASSIAIAFFPSLSRKRSSGQIQARAVRMYAASGLPLVAVLATIPEFLLTRIFPTQYGPVEEMLKYTAVTGLAAGGISLITTFFQAANDYSCLKWLATGLVGYVVSLLTGWRIDGPVGLAMGGAIGSAFALAIMGYRLIRAQGRVVLAWVPLAEPIMGATALVLSRSYPILWLAVACVVGGRASIHFLHPETRQARFPRWAMVRILPHEAFSLNSLLIETIWQEKKPKVLDVELRAALNLGCLNRVEGRLARAYPAQLADVLSEVNDATLSYVRVLHHAAQCLHRARIPALLIEEGLRGDSVWASVNFVIPRRHWQRASSALSGDGALRALVHQEQSERVVSHSTAQLRLRLHTDLSWLGIQFLPVENLMAHARRNREGVLVPSPVDHLRIVLGHSLVQQRELYLSELLVLWDLMHPAVVMSARAEAGREGWLRSFDEMLALAENAINLLDQGQPIALPATPLAVQSGVV